MHQEYEVLVTVRLPVTAIHQTDAQRIAADLVGRATKKLFAKVVKTET